MKDKATLLAEYIDDDKDDLYFIEVFIDIRDLLVKVVDLMEKQNLTLVSLDFDFEPSNDDSVGTTA
jgi:cephalosporin-C deacetylase-like acetyl esterase